jgi:hypothetical protein
MANVFEVGLDELIAGMPSKFSTQMLQEPTVSYLPISQQENELLKSENTNLKRELSMTRTTVKSLEMVIELLQDKSKNE